MKYIATLPMYDWPEARGELIDFWNIIAKNLKDFDIEAELLFPQTIEETQLHWRAPNLIFSQTCWGPLKNGWNAHLDVLAQPDYSRYLGGRKAFYRSAIVARNDNPFSEITVPNSPKADFCKDMVSSGSFAFNERNSLSGFIALEEDFGEDISAAFSNLIESGSHRDSIKLVSNGDVDFAAIDCRSWTMALEHEPAAKNLKTVGWTSERLGLPYVCNKALDLDAKSAIQKCIWSIAEIS